MGYNKILYKVYDYRGRDIKGSIICDSTKDNQFDMIDYLEVIDLEQGEVTKVSKNEMENHFDYFINMIGVHKSHHYSPAVCLDIWGTVRNELYLENMEVVLFQISNLGYDDEYILNTKDLNRGKEIVSKYLMCNVINIDYIEKRLGCGLKGKNGKLKHRLLGLPYYLGISSVSLRGYSLDDLGVGERIIKVHLELDNDIDIGEKLISYIKNQFVIDDEIIDLEIYRPFATNNLRTLYFEVTINTKYNNKWFKEMNLYDGVSYLESKIKNYEKQISSIVA